MTLTDGELTPEQITIINSRISNNALRFRNYYRYYEADNPALIDATKKKDPDNRVPCAFAGKIVDTMKGYMFKPGYITYQSKGKYSEELGKIFLSNDEPLKTAEIASDAMIFGVGYELLRVDETAKTVKQYRIRPDTGYAVYDNTLDEKILAFVHIVAVESDVSDLNMTYAMTIYYENFYVEYISATDGNWQEVGRKEHPFGMVPAIPYYISADRMPLFKKIIPIIDEHDKIISSNYANENERFANAYMLLGKKINNTIKDENGKTDAEKIAEIRMFDNLFSDGDISNVNNAVGFLTKPSRGSDVSESADRFERLVYDLAMVINPNDEHFAATSGIALKMKMIPMEFKAADIESYFSQGLQRRFAIFENARIITGLTPEQITISFKRNIPSDIEALSITAGNLKGIISDESILAMFPRDIVPDLAVEMERLENVASLDDVEMVSVEAVPDDEN